MVGRWTSTGETPTLKIRLEGVRDFKITRYQKLSSCCMGTVVRTAVQYSEMCIPLYWHEAVLYGIYAKLKG